MVELERVRCWVHEGRWSTARAASAENAVALAYVRGCAVLASGETVRAVREHHLVPCLDEVVESDGGDGQGVGYYECYGWAWDDGPYGGDGYGCGEREYEGGWGCGNGDGERFGDVLARGDGGVDAPLGQEDMPF